MADLDPDTKDRHDTLLHGEKILQNGKREDLPTLNEHVVNLSKSHRIEQQKVAAMEKACVDCRRAQPAPKITMAHAAITATVLSFIWGVIKTIYSTNGGTP